MAHVAKFNRGAVGGLSRHYERAKNQDGEYIKHKNQDIDYTRTHENYNLAPERNQLDFIKSRCDEANCLSRDNINVMCDWVVTAPKGIHELEDRRFFEESYKFLCDRYGEKNVVSAYVHNDETTPHMHFSFVPVGYDKKNDRETVSAKMVLNRGDLQTFHKDLDAHMAKAFGRDIGILNEATKEGNKSIEDLKRGTAAARISEATAQANQIIGSAKKTILDNVAKMQDDINKTRSDCAVMLSNARSEEQEIKDRLIPLEAEYRAKKAYVRACDESSNISMAIPEYAEVKERGFLKKEEYVTVSKEKWLEKHVSANEKSYLEKATLLLENKLADFKRTVTAENIGWLENRITELENSLKIANKDNSTLKIELQTVKKEIETKDKEIDKVIDRVNKTLSKLPEEASSKFISAWKNEKALEQAQEKKSYGHDR